MVEIIQEKIGTIVFKLVLPACSEAALNEYLVAKGLNRAFIFSDE